MVLASIYFTRPSISNSPPLLYIGFVGSSIYFSAALSSLITGYNNKNFAIQIKPWVKVTWFFQSLGIIVGSIWAYYELVGEVLVLWDPENASLMPWFAMTALIHSLIILERRESLYSWVIFLCLLTFYFKCDRHISCKIWYFKFSSYFANDPSRESFTFWFYFFNGCNFICYFFTKTEERNLYF